MLNGIVEYNFFLIQIQLQVQRFVRRISIFVLQIFPGEQGFTPRGSTVFNIVSATSDFSSA